MLFMFFNLIFLFQTASVPPPPDDQNPTPPPGLPVDSGLVILVVVALFYGVYKIIKHKQSLSA